MAEVLEKALIGTLLKFTSRKNGRPTSVGRKHGWIAQDYFYFSDAAKPIMLDTTFWQGALYF